MKIRLLLLAFTSLLSFAKMNAQNPMCTAGSAAELLDVNNVSALIQNGGDMWWDLVGTPHYEVPKLSGRNTFFTQSLWIGGMNMNSSLSLAGMKYRGQGVDYFPGPLNSQGTTTDNICAEFDRTFSVTRVEVENHKTGISSSNSILEWPGRGNPHNNMPLQDLAPFYDVNGDNIYNANDGDYPLIKGDKAIWYVFNDVGNFHTETGGEKIGIEVHVMAYAFKGDFHEDNATFYDYTIINKGESLADAYFGIFTDTDLGNPTDDFIACDTLRNMGMVYNGDPFDEDYGGILGYGQNPPLAGIRLLEANLVQQDSTMQMTSFITPGNNTGPMGDPSVAAEFFNYMRGIWRDNSLMYEGGTGHSSDPSVNMNQPVRFLFPGNPSNSNEWSECSAGNTPADRRMLMSVGPFPFQTGEVVEFTSVAIYVRPFSTASNCGVDFTPILEASDYLKNYHDSVENVFTSVPSTAKESKNRLIVYPNPAREYVSVLGLESTAHYELISLGGDVMKQGQIQKGEQAISLAYLSSGIYFIRISTAKETITQKLIID